MSKEDRESFLYAFKGRRLCKYAFYAITQINVCNLSYFSLETNYTLESEAQ